MIFGLDAVFVEGWDREGAMFKRGRGTAPPVHLAVVFDRRYGKNLEEALPKGLLRERKQSDKTEIYVSTSIYSDRSGNWPNLLCALNR